MTFQLAGRTQIVMLMVLACPKSVFCDEPTGRGPLSDQDTVLVVLTASRFNSLNAASTLEPA